MERQALKISSWAKNVYVKIPITNTKREKSEELIKKLSLAGGVKLNVTAIMNLDQVENVLSSLSQKIPSYISVFAEELLIQVLTHYH